MQRGYILIVDDEEYVREVLKDFFVSLGYGVETADCGEDALQKFIPGRFDSVISDFSMPDIDGMEVLKKIKAADKNVVFLMITGYPKLESAVKAIQHGAYDYITKPFKFEDIRIKLERALYAKRVEKSLKRANGVVWALIISIPVWLVLGILLGFILKWI